MEGRDRLQANDTPVKRCLSCQRYLPVDAFARNRASPSGRQAYCKACHRVFQKRWQDRVRREVINAYGGRCACCGEERIEFLTFDHINGDGNRHRREIAQQRGWKSHHIGGAKFALWLRKNGYPEGFRILCFNCNCAIAFHGTCPHQRSNSVEHSSLMRFLFAVLCVAIARMNMSPTQAST